MRRQLEVKIAGSDHSVRTVLSIMDEPFSFDGTGRAMVKLIRLESGGSLTERGPLGSRGTPGILVINRIIPSS